MNIPRKRGREEVRWLFAGAKSIFLLKNTKNCAIINLERRWRYEKINYDRYIGYKVSGVLGSVFATLGVVLPSFIIIFIISLFFDAFLSLEYVQYAFYGIQACVAFLILSAGIKMFKHVKRNVISVTLFALTVTAMLTLSLFAKEFSSIFYILIGGVVGLSVYLASYFKAKSAKKEKNEEQSIRRDNE